MSSKYAFLGVNEETRSMDFEPSRPTGPEVLYPTINYSLAVRDAAELVAEFPPSIQPYIATGMHAALSLIAPWLCERFLERLRTIPGCADTASAPEMESIYLMGYPDRGGRER